MVLILLSWIYISFITIGMGSLVFRFSKPGNLIFLIISGLFFQLLLIHFWALLFPVSAVFYAVNSLLSIVLIIFNKTAVRKIFGQTIADFKSWDPFLKLMFCFIGILALMQSSVSPYLPDNESYYIQSVKWLNGFGLVKGLGNLHLFFGQMSGWHLLQSSFGFGFRFDFLNDINGFLLIAVSFFCFDRLNHFFQNRNKTDLFAGLIPVSSVFLFRFLDAPSPDLPVFLIFPLMIWLFCKHFDSPGKQHIYQLLIFGLLLTLIKITAFPVLILALILMARNAEFKKMLRVAFLFCFVALIAFCSKNYIITGYLFNPTRLFGNLLNPDWKVPENLQQTYYAYTAFHAFNSPFSEFRNFEDWSLWTKFNLWFFSPKLHGFFNKLILVLLIVFPFRIRKNKAFLWIYFCGLIQFLVLFFTSPQYRFFFHIILVFGLIILAGSICKTQIRNVKALLALSIFPVILPLLIPVDLTPLTNNDFMKTQTNTFKTAYLFKPHKISQFNYHYEKITDGNLEYNSPENTFFWFSGDAELPAANRMMIGYFKESEKLKPQLRTGKLKDGFKSQKTEK